LPVGEVLDVSDRCAGEVVDADADQLAADVRDLVFAVPDQGQGAAVVVEPTEVGDEVFGQLEAS